MKTSEFLLATLKETPADAELVSHRLMLRAGMIRKVASGIYAWLPLGLRVLKKVERIVREEMERAGAQEVLMPAVQPAELWQSSKRWEKYGTELLRFKDRHDRDFCFGPTHEEVITDLAKRELKSYKQLPINFFQIQVKFRDEIRPRFGVMRAREFMMKDAYSFHTDNASLQKTYDTMHQAYCAIFTRLGLKFRPVLADTGAIGGHYSHEFQVLANSGEDVVVYSDQSDYAANLERAEAQRPNEASASSGDLEKFATPQAKTIKALGQQFNVPAVRSVKTLIVKGSAQPLVALILRGDHELNVLKAEKHPTVASPLTMATDAEIKAAFNCGPGSLGVVNLSMPMVVDHEAGALSDFVCGANEDGFHYKNVNWNRDADLTETFDLRNVVEGDLSPDGQGTLQFARGIEVGHIFQLGDIYSKAMELTVLTEAGKAINPLMGCYGLGVSRVVAAAIEQNHDEHGIIWPLAMAPFQMALIPMNYHKSYRVREAADLLLKQLTVAGYEVLMDDRKERPGVMFNTMDLIGIPHRIVLSERGLDAGTVEYKARNSDTINHLALGDLVALLQEKIQ